MSICVKQIGDHLPLAEVILARALVSLALSWWLIRRSDINPWGIRRNLLFLRGLIGTVALTCVYSSLTRLPLANATVLQYLHPTFTALLASFWLREPIGKNLIIALGLGWIGVVLVAKPSLILADIWSSSDHSLPLDGVAISIVGALLSATAYVVVRNLTSTEHPLVIVFYFPLVAVPISVPLVLFNPVVPTLAEMIWLLGIGLFTQLGQIGLTKGLAALPAARATSISYVQVVFATLWGWLIFAEPISSTTISGACLILFAGWISIHCSSPGSAKG